jgi:hypothetical protein
VTATGSSLLGAPELLDDDEDVELVDEDVLEEDELVEELEVLDDELEEDVFALFDLGLASLLSQAVSPNPNVNSNAVFTSVCGRPLTQIVSTFIN